MMRYRCLAVDFDETLAHRARVDPRTLDALERLRDGGRRLLMVTGRELDDLLVTFPEISLFDRVVVENGAVLYEPASGRVELLADPPPARFIEEVRARGVPLSAGRVIASTRVPHETTVLEVIRDLGLELHLIFNKGAVMVLPVAVSKATGMNAALVELGLSPHGVVGMGDGENDHHFLQFCHCGVAVAGAVATLRSEADVVTRGDNGHGVQEIIQELLDDDLRGRDQAIRRHDLLLGLDELGEAIEVPPLGSSVLAAADGRSIEPFVNHWLRELEHKRFQYCVVRTSLELDPPAEAVALGAADHPPRVDDLLDLLRHPLESVVADISALGSQARTQFVRSLLEGIEQLRDDLARPHWLILDEADDLLSGAEAEAEPFPEAMFVVRRADRLDPAVFSNIDVALATGDQAPQLIRLAQAQGQPLTATAADNLHDHECLVWLPRYMAQPRRLHAPPTVHSH